MEEEINEQEQLAKEYFGEEFVNEFESLKQKLKNEKTMLRLHGTDKEKAESILKDGLEINSPSVTYTSYSESSYNSMKNWKHRDYKYLVLLGIPNEATMYDNFEYDENGEMIGEKEEIKNSKPLLKTIKENTGYHDVYKLPAEFIVGYIDVNEKKIIENPLYLSEHTYEGLYVIDSDLGLDLERTIDFDEKVYGGYKDVPEWDKEFFEQFKEIDESVSPTEREEGISIVKDMQSENEKDKELSEEDWINGW